MKIKFKIKFIVLPLCIIIFFTAFALLSLNASGLLVWDSQTLDSTNSVGMETPSIAIDGNSHPHISYGNNWGNLTYAKWNGSSWEFHTVDSGGVGRYTSIALDSNGYPHISYHDDTNDALKYARWTGSTWYNVTVDSEGNVGRYNSIALDSNNYPHISYYYQSGNYLKYAKWNGSAWLIETIDKEDAGGYTSITIDNSDKPHISYHNYTGWDLKYVRWTGAKWCIETVDSIGGVGGYTSIALDTNGFPHISYYDYTNTNLKYAKWTGSTWINETVDSEGNIGRHTSIALDNNNYPHISYLDSTNGNLKYAKWTGSEWLIQTVDTKDNAGYDTSIALDGNDIPHIAYTASLGGSFFRYSTLVPATVPTSPLNLKAITENGQVSLLWVAPASDGGTPITNYNIYRGTNSGEETLLDTIGNILCYNDTTVTNGTTYYYFLTAINSIGEGKQSTEINATPMTIPSAPQNLQITTGDGYLNLTWNAPANNGGGTIVCYNIYRNGTVGVYDIVPAINNWYNDTNVINGITYTYNVTALNIIGEGPNSTQSEAIPMTTPTAPTSLQANVGDGFVNLTWDPPENDGGSSIIVYNIYRNDTTGIYDSVSSNQLWYNDTEVVNGITYIYNITAVNNVNEGMKSLGVSVTPRARSSDIDQDGLPDTWELEYFGNLTYDINDDPDGDGYNNLQEYQTNTDPTDKEDYPGIMKPDEGKPFFSQNWWIFMIIAVVIVTLLIAILLWKRASNPSKKSPSENSEEVEYTSQVTIEESVKESTPKRGNIPPPPTK